MIDVVVNIFRVIAVVLIAVMWLYTLKKYRLLPDKIPTHFDFEQKPDSYGSKKFVFLLPSIAVLMSVLMFYGSESSYGNYPVKITNENFDVQFSIMQILLSWLSVVVTCVLFNIQDYMIRLSLNSEAKPRIHLLLSIVFIFLSVMTAIILAYIYK